MLLKNTVYNLIGLGAPLLVAVVSIPLLIAALGADRFGLLTLVWAVVSYFGLFDLGLGRALTQQLSVVIANKEHDQIGPLVGTATVLMAGLGIIAGLLLAAIAPWGVQLIQGVPDKNEAINAVYAMALAMPAIILTSGFRGILEAKHAFGIVNLIRLPMGLFTFLGPLAVVYFAHPRLDWIALVLTGGRLVGCVVYAWYAWKALPNVRGHFRVEANLLRRLCVSGGWLTVSNIVSPFMGYVDRFLIGAIVSAEAVAYYATPNELVTKLWIVPGALTTVLFPTFAAQMAKGGEHVWPLFKKAVHWLYVALMPATMVLMIFSNELLTWWISAAFAKHSATLLQIFAVGILINSLAHVPFTLIQSAGSARLTALVHTGELPFFLVFLWWLTLEYGVFGAALAWLTRMVADTLLMFMLSSSIVGRSKLEMINIRKTAGLALLALLGFSGVLLESHVIRIAWMIGVVCLICVTLLPRRLLPWIR